MSTVRRFIPGSLQVIPTRQCQPNVAVRQYVPDKITRADQIVAGLEGMGWFPMDLRSRKKWLNFLYINHRGTKMRIYSHLAAFLRAE